MKPIEYFAIFFLCLLVVQMLLPLAVAMWSKSSTRSKRKDAPESVQRRRDLVGWIMTTMWVMSLLTVVTGFAIYSAKDSLDKGMSDAIPFVVFAVFCVAIWIFMAGLCLSMVRFKAKVLRETDDQ